MLKSLAIDTYLNGYNVSQVNCQDLMIAGATGYFDYHNYFYYALYRTFYYNWQEINKNNQDFCSSRNEMLKKLGLELKSVSVTNSRQLLTTVKQLLDGSHPVLMVVRYDCLFYDVHYLDPTTHHDHCFLVSDYYSNKPILTIREWAHIKNTIRPLTNADPLSHFNITETILTDIWENSNLRFRKEHSEHFQRIYFLEKTTQPQIDSYCQLFADLLPKDQLDTNNLANFINTNQDPITPEIAENIKKLFYGSIYVLFDIVEKELLKNTDAATHTNFENFKQEYLQFRNRVLAKLVAQSFRGEALDCQTKTELTKHILAFDLKLFELIKALSNQASLEYQAAIVNKATPAIAASLSDLQLINFSIQATASANSEYRPAGQVVNGKQNSLEDSWRSANFAPPHWLLLDLQQPRTIAKFTIKHYYANPLCITRDFQIQGSIDGTQWDVLFEIKDNTNVETTLVTEPTTYQFVRLYITKPSLMDDSARIYEFEVWGHKL